MITSQKLTQRPDELAQLIRLIGRHGVRSYLEIGLKYGETFAQVGACLPHGSTMVGVDLPGALWGAHKQGPERIKAATDPLRTVHDVSIIWGDSTATETVDAVHARGPYDLALIDGDHRLEAVRSDWNNYSPMSRIVAFHDIDVLNGNPLPKRFEMYGVHTLWESLKAEHSYIEIIGCERGMGIGVIFQNSLR